MDSLADVSYRHFLVGVSFGLILGIGYEYVRVKFFKSKGTSGGGGGDDGRPSEHVSNGEGDHKLVLVVRTDLKMGKGKVAAQCSHAAVAAYRQAADRDPRALREWLRGGQPKVTLRVDSESEMLALQKRAHERAIATNLVRDAGRTQIAPGSKTVLAIGPARRDLVDDVTGDLKLY